MKWQLLRSTCLVNVYYRLFCPETNMRTVGCTNIQTVLKTEPFPFTNTNDLSDCDVLEEFEVDGELTKELLQYRFPQYAI